ncbi:hypothetical protein [Flavobacterium rhizosphaerae]|uniref:Uncharacterized protein n=1 Tax=Flavobacterium rhizosphaerae TaxID=3163298 RepID=A0ABW8YWP5_9FLAO
MKKMFSAIAGAFFWLIGQKKKRQFETFEKQLKAAHIKQQSEREVEQIVLKYKITKHLYTFLGIKGHSKFIPLHIKNKEKCRKEVLAKFGRDMDKWGVILNDDLSVCIR